jgi:hypothetical protein
MTGLQLTRNMVLKLQENKTAQSQQKDIEFNHCPSLEPSPTDLTTSKEKAAMDKKGCSIQVISEHTVLAVASSVKFLIAGIKRGPS